MRYHAILLTICTAASHAVPKASPPHAIHERRLVPLDADLINRADGDAIAAFHIAAKQSNIEHSEAYVLNVSHPASPDYGKHWTAEDVKRIFAPSVKTIDAIQDWLGASGIYETSHRNGWLSFNTSISQAEALLRSEYYEYRDDTNGAVRLGCNEYQLPQHLADHVDYVSPGVALSPPLKRTQIRKRDSLARRSISGWVRDGLDRDALATHVSNETLPVDLQKCGQSITPSCLRALYNIPGPEIIARDFSGSSDHASLGVFEALNYYNQSDLDAFFAAYAPHVPNGTHPLLASIEGAQVNQSATPFDRNEADVDIDILYALTYPKNITLYQVTGAGYQTQINQDNAEGYAVNNLLDAFDDSFCSEQDAAHGMNCGTSTPATVISVSYGTGELYYPEKQQHRQCFEFMKLALQGHTVAVASGDWGVANEWNHTTLTNGCIVPGNYSATVNNAANGTVFHPQYPASCPYVLSVGATMLNENETVCDAEVAMHEPLAESITFNEKYGLPNYPTTTSSSGGFSNYFFRPTYQDLALDTYFANHEPAYPFYASNGIDASLAGTNIGSSAGVYNRVGRGIPDVSANGARFMTPVDGNEVPVWGTSLATPIWAALLILINERRHAVGKSSVGFVNPVLYEHPEVFHDITSGVNPGCGTSGFEAVSGWDPVTGLGTPDFPKMLDLFLSLP